MNNIIELNQYEITNVAGGGIVNWAKNHPYASIAIGTTLLAGGGIAAFALSLGTGATVIATVAPAADIGQKIWQWASVSRRILDALDAYYVLQGGTNPIGLSAMSSIASARALLHEISNTNI